MNRMKSETTTVSGEEEAYLVLTMRSFQHDKGSIRRRPLPALADLLGC